MRPTKNIRLANSSSYLGRYKKGSSEIPRISLTTVNSCSFEDLNIVEITICSDRYIAVEEDSGNSKPYDSGVQRTKEYLIRESTLGTTSIGLVSVEVDVLFESNGKQFRERLPVRWLVH